MLSVIYEPKGRAREYGALAANLYKGCSHGCVYCYAPAATFTDRPVFHGQPTARAGIMAKLEKDCRELQGTGQGVLLSFTTDPYQALDVDLQYTRQAIQLLHAHGLYVEILTKGGNRAVRDFDLLTERDAFATTMTFLDARRSREWEPEAALPGDRMDAMQQAHARSIRTWASLEPVLDPDASLEIIRQTHPYVDLYKIGTLNHHPLSKSIDWAAFGREAVALCQSLGKDYYVKRDLAEKIPGCVWHEPAKRESRDKAGSTRGPVQEASASQGALF